MRIQAADALIKAFQRAVAVASATTTTTTTNPRLPTSPLSTHVISLRTLENKPWPSTSLTPQNPILILDSSFNPPTLAHFHLALKSLHATSPSFSSLIILHAVSNADKPETDPMDLLHRVNMMFRMASDLKSNVSVIVGLTTAARFIDKAKSLRDVLFSTATSFEMPRLHWVMGYDTVTRLLHPKYYTTPTTPSTREDTVLSALAPMFDPETGANGVLVLFDRIVPAGGIGAGDTLDHYLATDPTAAKLVEMGRVKVVEGWTNLLIEKGGEVDVVLKCEVAEVDATLLEGGREAALRSLADEGSELSKRVIEAFQKCEVPSFIGNPDNDVWKQGWKSEVGVVISSGDGVKKITVRLWARPRLDELPGGAKMVWHVQDEAEITDVVYGYDVIDNAVVMERGSEVVKVCELSSTMARLEVGRAMKRCQNGVILGVLEGLPMDADLVAKGGKGMGFMCGVWGAWKSELVERKRELSWLMNDSVAEYVIDKGLYVI